MGTSLILNDRPYTIVGVLPPRFDFSSVFSPSIQVDMLLPFTLIAAGEAGFQGNTLHLLGRLRPGVTIEAAQAELDAILATLARQDPARWGPAAVATPLQAHIAGPFRPAMLLLADSSRPSSTASASEIPARLQTLLRDQASADPDNRPEIDPNVLKALKSLGYIR